MADPENAPKESPTVASQGTLVSIYRYPVKGLSAELLPAAALGVGATLPLDRAWAIENGAGRFDPGAARWLPKINFLMLMRNERLAGLETRLEPDGHTLVVHRAGRQVARGDLETRIGRQMLEQFFAAYMKTELRGAPRIVSADGHSFSDVAAKVLHVVNLASVRDLERITGRSIDPLRFRANLYLDGFAPWAERDWIGRSLVLGDARLRLVEETDRCEATNVDPATGARDRDIPAALERAFGRTDFGAYARVVTAGSIAPGMAAAIA
jgi:uncharacterized protein YcbX